MDRASDSEALRNVVAEFDLDLVVLFGSRARDEHRPDSDTDFGVLRRGGRRFGHRELGALHLALSRSFGAHADVVDLSSADALLRYEIISHGRPIVEVEPGIWSDFVARALIDHDDVAPYVRECIAAVGRAAREAAGS